MMDVSYLDGGDSGKCQRLKWNTDDMEKAFRLSSVTKCVSLQLPRCLVSPGRLGCKDHIRHGSKLGVSTTLPPEEGKSLVQ